MTAASMHDRSTIYDLSAAGHFFDASEAAVEHGKNASGNGLSPSEDLLLTLTSYHEGRQAVRLVPRPSPGRGPAKGG